MPTPIRRCTKCKQVKPISDFSRAKAYRGGRHTQCKKCMVKYQQAKLATPAQRMIAYSKMGARNRGLKHTITVDDLILPERCPYLGIIIDYRSASERECERPQNGPSVDRIDSTKDYVPGNVQVISTLANRMKQEATPEQLIAFAKGVLALHSRD